MHVLLRMQLPRREMDSPGRSLPGRHVPRHHAASGRPGAARSAPGMLRERLLRHLVSFKFTAAILGAALLFIYKHDVYERPFVNTANILATIFCRLRRVLFLPGISWCLIPDRAFEVQNTNFYVRRKDENWYSSPNCSLIRCVLLLRLSFCLMFGGLPIGNLLLPMYAVSVYPVCLLRRLVDLRLRVPRLLSFSLGIHRGLASSQLEAPSVVKYPFTFSILP